MKKYFFLLGCLVVSQLLCFVNVGWALSCNGVGGNWSSPSSWALCSGGVPGGGDTAKFIVGAVNLNTDVTVDQIRIEGGTLNAGTHTITLSNTTPFAPVAGGGTFNADTGTVKLTKADHTIINDFTYNNLIMEPLTAPRTITIGDAGLSISITVTGTFISGSGATKQVSFVKGVAPPATVNVTTPVTSLYCADNGGITNITCLPGGPMPTAPTGLTVSAVTQTSIDLTWNDNSSNETGFKVYDGGVLITSPHASAGSTVSLSIDGFSCGTTHTFTVRANNDGTLSTPSNTVTATTSACPVTAGVTLNSVSNITGSTVLATGTATGTGIGERGFYWWIPPSTETHFGGSESGLIPEGNYGAGNFSLNLTGLKPGNKYHMKAYVKVGSQIITSDEQLFTTATTGATGKMAPTVLTDTKNFTVSGSSITVSGEITDIGSSAVNVYGFVYAPHTAPFTGEDMPKTGDRAYAMWDQTPVYQGMKFTGTIKNIPPGKWYLRAYGHNVNPDSDAAQTASLGYGADISFTIACTPETCIPGDVNGDGKVDLADAMLVLRILAGMPVANVNLNADLNGDGKIGLEELGYILQKVAGLR